MGLLARCLSALHKAGSHGAHVSWQRSMSTSLQPLTVGMVGLGNMGSGMAKNLFRSGFPVCMFDVAASRAQELQQSLQLEAGSSPPDHDRVRGATVADSPAQVMQSSNVVLVCVYNETQGKEVILGDSGLLLAGREATAGSVVVDLGTVSPGYSKQMAEEVARAGAGYLDAPVSGGPQGANEGTLSIMVGGEQELFSHCLPVLEAIGTHIVHMGGAAAGTAAKLVNQHLVICNTAAACEAYVLARRLGLRDSPKLLDLLSRSWGNSLMLEKTFQDMAKAEAAGDIAALSESRAPVRTLLKDGGIIAQAAAEARLDLPVFPAGNAQVGCAVERGLGGSDFAILTEVMSKDQSQS